MPQGRLEVIRVVPTPGILGQLVRRFGKNEYGIVTSLSDGSLSMLREALDENTLVDVKPFGEVVRQIYNLAGLEARRIATPRQTLAAIRLTCNELGSGSMFRHVAEFKGFHEALRTVLRDFEHAELTPGKLAVIGEKIGGQSGSKVSELAMIWHKVSERLAEIKAVSASWLMQACIDEIDRIDTDGQELRLQVILGSELHPLAMSWLKWLVDCGAEVTIIGWKHATGGSVYHDIELALEGLDTSATVGEGSLLTRNLFADQVFEGTNSVQLETHVSGDPLAECEWALRTWAERGETESAAIFARDIQKYGPLLQAAAERLGVHVIVRRRVPLSETRFIRDWRAVFESFESRPFVGYSPSLIGAEKIEDLNLLNWGNLELSEDERVKSLLEIRETWTQDKRKYVDWHQLLKDFFESAPWVDSIISGPTFGRDQRTYTALVAAMGQEAILLDRNSKDEPVSFSDWLNHFIAVCESADVSVPSEEEGLKLVSHPDDLDSVKELYVLGLIEGAFPRRRSEDPILTDAEKSLISNHLIEHLPLADSFRVANRERDLFYSLCARCAEYLHLSYPMPQGDSEAVAAFYLKEVQRIIAEGSSFVHQRRQIAPVESPFQTDRILSEKLLSGNLQIPTHEVTVEENLEFVRFNREDVRPRQLLSLSQCHFQFTADRKLPRLNRDGDRWSLILDIPRDARLLTAPDPATAKSRMIEALDQLIVRQKMLLPKWELDLLAHGAAKMMDRWIEREFLSRETWSRDPRKTVCGGEFGLNGLAKSKMGYSFLGKVAGTTVENEVRTVHLYSRRPPKIDDKDQQASKERQLLKYFAYFASAWNSDIEPIKRVRIDIEGPGDHRTLLLCQSAEYAAPPKANGLEVINLAIEQGTGRELRDFAVQMLDHHVQETSNGDIRPTPSANHCGFCDFAELCRVAYGNSEEYDPFEGDDE